MCYIYVLWNQIIWLEKSRFVTNRNIDNHTRSPGRVIYSGQPYSDPCIVKTSIDSFITRHFLDSYQNIIVSNIKDRIRTDMLHEFLAQGTVFRDNDLDTAPWAAGMDNCYADGPSAENQDIVDLLRSLTSDRLPAYCKGFD